MRGVRPAPGLGNSQRRPPFWMRSFRAPQTRPGLSPRLWGAFDRDCSHTSEPSLPLSRRCGWFGDNNLVKEESSGSHHGFFIELLCLAVQLACHRHLVLGFLPSVFGCRLVLTYDIASFLGFVEGELQGLLSAQLLRLPSLCSFAGDADAEVLPCSFVIILGEPLYRARHLYETAHSESTSSTENVNPGR